MLSPKVCTRCNELKDPSEYTIAWKRHLPNPRPDGYLPSMCKSCTVDYKREYSKTHPDKVSSHNKKRKKKTKIRNLRYVFEYFKTHPCVDCGETNPVVLEFDHKNPNNKTIEVSKLIMGVAGLDTLQTEMDKCDVRCANCHRVKTSKQYDWYKVLMEDR